jgi:hypothetical protein
MKKILLILLVSSLLFVSCDLYSPREQLMEDFAETIVEGTTTAEDVLTFIGVE